MSKPHFGKVAIVTGGAGGMGRAHALRLAELGASVAIVDIDLNVAARHHEKLSAPTVLQEIEAFGVGALAIEADISDPRAALAAVRNVEVRFGHLDILVNNAGGAITAIQGSSAATSSAEDRQTLFAANFDTAVNMCQAAAPLLVRQGGAIVNISTIGAWMDDAGARYALYGAAKAAVEKYTRSLAVELGPRGVRVNCIAPGLIATPRVAAQARERGLATESQATGIPLRRLGRVSDVVGVMEFLVGDLSAYVTGECLKVSGGHTLVSAT